MVQINFAAREVNCKIVYYGPAMSGKTTNLEVLHAKAPEASKGRLITIATETDRTLYFDLLPLDLGQIAGMRTKLQVYTVPGQVIYRVTRKVVLNGADGVIFVADSNPAVRQANVQSLHDMAQNLRENGLSIGTVPLVFQWNKRDLADAMPVEQMNAELNFWQAPACEAIAVAGKGVSPTLGRLASLVMKDMNRKQGFAEDGVTRLGGRPAKAPPRGSTRLPKRPAAASGGRAPAQRRRTGPKGARRTRFDTSD